MMENRESRPRRGHNPELDGAEIVDLKNEIERSPHGAGLLNASTNSPFIWDRLENESEEHFNWFRWYYEMGPTRNIRSLSMLTGQSEMDLIAVSKRYAWDLRVSQREHYQTAVLSQFFSDEQKTKELVLESLLNDTLSEELMAITQDMAEVRTSGEPIPLDKRIRRAEKLLAIKNAIVKSRSEKQEAANAGVTINVLPRDIVEAIHEGKVMPVEATDGEQEKPKEIEE